MILSLRIDEAHNIIENNKKINPENLYNDYLESFSSFLKITLSNDEKLFENLKPGIFNTIKKLETLPDTTPWKNYLIGNLRLQLATLNFNFKNYTSGAMDMNKSYRLLTTNKENFPKFIPNNISLGVLHIIIGLVPDSYSWILNIINMQGGITMGMDELNKSYKQCNNTNYYWLKNEIVFYSGMIGINIIPDKAFADSLLTKIDTNTSTNLLSSYLKINILMKSGKNDEALKVFSQIDSTTHFYPFYYLKLLHGECYLRKLEPNKAIYQLKLFVKNYKGINYIKDAWQKIGWCYFLNGDTTLYINNIGDILKNGDENTGSDKAAQNAAKLREMPNSTLLKTRLLFDGGYYNKALDLILNSDTASFTNIEKVEFYYRLGRIYHQMDKIEESLKNYNFTIETGSNLLQYYAANAALQSAYIYEYLNDTSLSIQYYETCLSLDFKEYRYSIRSKAKQGLKRVKNQ